VHIVILSPAKDLTPLASDKRQLLAARHFRIVYADWQPLRFLFRLLNAYLPVLLAGAKLDINFSALTLFAVLLLLQCRLLMLAALDPSTGSG
jgi:hypothetical protein